MKSDLSVSNLFVSVEGKDVVNGISLTVKPGEVHVVMGPNGSGKSSLANSLAGNPVYKIKKGSIKLGNTNLTKAKPDERARAGLFLSFQTPVAVPGVPLDSFLRTSKSLKKKKLDLVSFQEKLGKVARGLHFQEKFLNHPVNDGLSGGERKKSEVLQLVALGPKFAILDEIDTGLDVDALKIISKAIKAEVERGLGVILVTHYCRMLKYIKPDKVHVLIDGKIIKSGGMNLAFEIEKKGYENITS